MAELHEKFIKIIIRCSPNLVNASVYRCKWAQYVFLPVFLWWIVRVHFPFPSHLFFLTAVWSSHPSCWIYSPSCEWMGLSVTGGCEVTPLAEEHRLAPGRSSCLAVLWLTDCSLGTRTSSRTAGQTATWKPAIQLISTTISLTAILTQPPLRCRFTHLCSHSRPVVWSPVKTISPLFHFYNRGEAQTRVQILRQFSWNAELNTELCVSL